MADLIIVGAGLAGAAAAWAAVGRGQALLSEIIADLAAGKPAPTPASPWPRTSLHAPNVATRTAHAGVTPRLSARADKRKRLRGAA
jgi:2-polyprenyl-6-methoxyphenol hydroxylase-like FAD-dependent oxidoreductase